MMNFNPENHTGNGLDSLSPEIKTKYLALRSVFDGKYAEAKKNNRILDFHEEITKFANKLKGTYSDTPEYLFFHILVGSTPPSGVELTKTDFPNEDSIETYINDLP